MKITKRLDVVFGFKYLLQGWIIAYCRLFKWLVSNNNPHELSVKNLSNLFKRGLSASFFVCVLGVYALYLLLENKRHTFQFIEKPENLINKISIFPLNNITYIILG